MKNNSLFSKQQPTEIAPILNNDIDDLFEKTKIYHAVSCILNRDFSAYYINDDEKLSVHYFSNQLQSSQHLELLMINQSLEKNTQEQAALLNANVKSIEKQFEQLTQLQTDFDALTSENVQLKEKIAELNDDNAHYESLLEALLVSLQMANDKIVTLQTAFKNSAL
ncbi:MAG: hypothetical protein WAX77_02105 [Methylococcaceae bacterium]